MEVKKVTKDVRIYPPEYAPAITRQLIEDGVDFKITNLREGLGSDSVKGISVEIIRIPSLPPFVGVAVNSSVSIGRDPYDLAFTRAENATIPEPAWPQEERDAHERQAGEC